MTVRIGISGWRYPRWRGSFYSSGLPPRREHAAWLVADAAGKWPFYEEVTADFVYVRLHGATERYASGYSEAELQDWARRVDAWHGGREVSDARRCTDLNLRTRRRRDVYVYFDMMRRSTRPGLRALQRDASCGVDRRFAC